MIVTGVFIEDRICGWEKGRRGKIVLHKTGALLSKVDIMNMSRIFKIFHSTIKVNCERLLPNQNMFKPTAKVLPVRS